MQTDSSGSAGKPSKARANWKCRRTPARCTIQALARRPVRRAAAARLRQGREGGRAHRRRDPPPARFDGREGHVSAGPLLSLARRRARAAPAERSRQRHCHSGGALPGAARARRRQETLASRVGCARPLFVSWQRARAGPRDRARLADVPTEVGAMVDAMIARDRERRPVSLADVARVFAAALGVSAPAIAPPKQRNRSASAAGAAFSRASDSERDPTQGSFESDSAARPKASLRNWAFVALGVGSLVALAVFATRAAAPPRGDLATGAPAGAPLNTAEAAEVSLEPAPAIAMATSTAVATTIAATVEPEASASASSSARATMRKTPKRAASALYDDPSELDFRGHAEIARARAALRLAFPRI